MIRTGLLSVFLLSRLVCAAQDGAPPAYAVHGIVVNALTNQPIARAEVLFNQEYAVLTDSEGRFEFDQMPAGDFQVSVRRPGYSSIGIGMNGPLGRGFPPPSTPARHIRVGPNMPGLTFRLAPIGTIRGQISLSASDPADGIRVTAYGKQWVNGFLHWEMAGSATTDSEGVYHLGNLVPGKYMLYTEPSLDRPGIAIGGTTLWGYPAVYYPGVTDAASAGVVTIAAGQTVEADFALTRQAFYPLTAQVRGVEAGRHAMFEILDTAGRFTNMPARYDPRTQVVHANVPNGSWVLEAHSFGSGPSPQEQSFAFGRTAFQVTSGPVQVAITVVPVPKLQVTIRREFRATGETAFTTGRPTAGVNLMLDRADPFAQGGMIAGLQFDPNTDPSAETTTGTMDAMVGRYWVQANNWGSYASSISSGGVDLAANPLVVSPNSGNAPIEVVLRNDFGSITGQIIGQAGNEDGTGQISQVGEVRDTYLYAIPLFRTTSTISLTSMNGPGQFQIPQVAPGSYRVVACDSPQEFDFHTPDGLAGWAGKGQVVTVEAGGTATVQLELLHVEQEP